MQSQFHWDLWAAKQTGVPGCWYCREREKSTAKDAAHWKGEGTMIKIVREPDDLRREPAECCHFCDERTRYWHTPTNTPCCPPCAEVKRVSDIKRPVHPGGR